MKNKILTLAFTFVTLFSFAQQQTENIEMADVLRISGKIYVVVLVLSIIFLGIIIYLISINRKLSRLEKEIKK
ncbi:MAG: CcmD family protein [Bacteroidetes bacterium RIFCSPLOWO2_12_FULL_35_15]|nr:MAG: CcmD family protein [Bacteroidetes bacterium RIFCSPLOWO2_12_FULL_35_15]